MRANLWRPNSVRNQGSRAPRYIPAVETATVRIEQQDPESVADYYAGIGENPPADAEWESGWIARITRVPGHGDVGPHSVVYESGAEAMAAALATLEREGYLRDEAKARRLAQEHADRRGQAAVDRAALRDTLAPMLAELGADRLADRLGVGKNHVGNLVKFVQGRKPNVPGEDLAIIAARVKQ